MEEWGFLFITIPVICMFGGLIGLIIWDTNSRTRRAEENYNEATLLVSEWATRLESQNTANGGLARFNDENSGEIPCVDSWNNNLRYTYFADSLAEYLQVRSLGPDRTIETADDIVDTRQVEVIHITE